MSKFLTPPVWYDKNGKLNEMLTGTAMPGEEGFPLTNLSIGQYSVAGDADGTAFSNFGTAVGYDAKASGNSTVLGARSSAKNGIAIGSFVKVTGGIGIGGDATEGGIGIGGDATEGKIQLGNPNLTYDLKIGNGTRSTVQAGGYKIGTTTIIDSSENIRGNSFLSRGYIQCPVLQISSNGVGYGNFTQSTKRGPIKIDIGDSDNALYLITIMARHEDGTYRQHFGFISSSKFPPDHYTPDTAIEVPMIVKANNDDAPYSNNWSWAYFEFSKDTENHPLYCDFTKVIRSEEAMLPYNTNVLEVWVYVHKIINFPNPLTT